MPLIMFELLCLIILSVGTLSISWEIFETLFLAYNIRLIDMRLHGGGYGGVFQQHPAYTWLYFDKTLPQLPLDISLGFVG